jgi:hypothetical protein
MPWRSVVIATIPTVGGLSLAAVKCPSAAGIAARGSDIEVVRLEVVYSNGVPDELDVRRVIRRGDRTERLDLNGRDRAIQRIDMVYRQRGDDRGRATVCAEGLVS